MGNGPALFPDTSSSHFCIGDGAVLSGPDPNISRMTVPFIGP